VQPCWFVDPPLRAWNGTWSPWVMDSKLRPIGNPPDDAVDETLRVLTPGELA
jgi:hypothetical protein